MDSALRLTEQEREDAKAEWRVAAKLLKQKDVVPKSPVNRALIALQAVRYGIVKHPETLSLGALERVLAAVRVIDTRVLWCAHHLLLFADRLGLFARKTADETRVCQMRCCEAFKCR